MLRSIALSLAAAGALTAQASVSADEDPASLPLVTLTANATHARRNTTTTKNAYAVRNYQVITSKQVVVSNCDLLVDGDGHLRLERCWLRIDGDMFLKDRGILELVDCRVQLENTYPKQYNFWWEGGELRTTRCIIGGKVNAAGIALTSVFELHRGHWSAVDTTIQYSGGVLIGLGRRGFDDDPFLRGGSLYADGLHQGAIADAVIASGYGDIVLRNSTFNLNISLYADSGRVAQGAIDFTTNAVIANVVYGDRTILDSMASTRRPVTNDIPGLPYRLELDNTVIPFWFVGIYEVVTNGPRATFEFRDPSGLIVAIHATDLQGAPSPVGPWSNYVSRIPQLPCVEPGGLDEIPPGCGVRIGNVDIVAPANRPARISSWSFALAGQGTNFAVRGPTKIAEIVMLDGQFAVTGSEAYDARISANSISLHRDASLHLTNVSIGQFESAVSAQPYLELAGIASCTIDRALIQGLQVRSRPEAFCCRYQGVEATTLQITNFVERDQPLDVVATGQSTFSVQRATPSQSFDLSNSNMDSPPLGGAPAYWASSNLSAVASTDQRPASMSNSSTGFQTQGGTATMTKSVVVSPGCFVAVRAWVKPIQVPANATLQLRVAGQASGATVVAVPLTVPSTNNGWRQVILPPHAVAALDGSIDIEFLFAGNGLGLRVDDVDIRPISWWDWNTLANLDFDASDFIGYLFPPWLYRYPAFWGVWSGNASFEHTLTRPNAAAGSRGVRLAVVEGQGQLYKILDDVAAGTTIHVTGWMRVVAPQRESLTVHVGDEARWWDSSYNNNQALYVFDARTWTSFTVDYTVPTTASRTRIAITGAAPGTDILVDDVEVSFR